ncbi:MAG: response regulator transcription factor [Lachnospiraceae bacterium]|nr:response regulator transcription factor [Lachnospiraceae bacterium]
MQIVIIDDDQLVALSLKTILESDSSITVIATGQDGAEAISLYRKYRPDVLLMDIQMKGISGLEAAEEIRMQDKEAKILFLTTFSDDEYIVRALQVGAKGYILKQDYEGIIPALYAVQGGQSVFGGEIVQKIPELIGGNEEAFDFAAYDISEKEQTIIEQVAQGHSNREIAEELFLSEGTVRNYISSVLDKLSLRDRTQLAVFYYQKVKRY